jgi:hypothetical protein
MTVLLGVEKQKNIRLCGKHEKIGKGSQALLWDDKVKGSAHLSSCYRGMGRTAGYPQFCSK